MMPFLQPSNNSLPLCFSDSYILSIAALPTLNMEFDKEQKKINPSYQDETRRGCHLNHHASNELRTTAIPFNPLFWKESFELELTGMLTLLSFFFSFFFFFLTLFDVLSLFAVLSNVHMRCSLFVDKFNFRFFLPVYNPKSTIFSSPQKPWSFLNLNPSFQRF